MPDDHSELVPLLPIPNRTVKRLSADDSAGSRVKVGHRQALTARKAQQFCWAFCFLCAPLGVENEVALARGCTGVDQLHGQHLYPMGDFYFGRPALVHQAEIGGG